MLNECRAAARKVAHLSAEERVARGKAARNEVPRSAATDAGSRRATGPTRSSLLEEQGTSRVPELVPIRYGRMMVSPFTFYRGAALIMAADLAATPRSGLNAQICGDAHLSNFGVFASPERQADVRHQRLRRDPSRARGSGTSSGSRRASRSPAGTAGSPRRTGGRSSRRAWPGTGPGCSSSPACATSTSGTPTSRSRSCSSS